MEPDNLEDRSDQELYRIIRGELSVDAVRCIGRDTEAHDRLKGRAYRLLITTFEYIVEGTDEPTTVFDAVFRQTKANLASYPNLGRDPEVLEAAVNEALFALYKAIRDGHLRGWPPKVQVVGEQAK